MQGQISRWNRDTMFREQFFSSAKCISEVYLRIFEQSPFENGKQIQRADVDEF